MNYTSMNLALLTIIACASQSTQTATIQERQEALIASYTALMNEWAPAFAEVSEASLKAVIKNKKAAVSKMKDSGFLTKSEEEKATALIKTMGIWPFKYISEQLDRDIRTVMALNNEAHALGISVTWSIQPLHDLRVRIEALPCFQNEQKNIASLGCLQTKYLMGLSAAAVGYYMYYNNISFTDVITSLSHESMPCLAASTAMVCAALYAFNKKANDATTKA